MKTKSGIESPADYNGKAPASIAAPTKVYPGSQSIGRSVPKSGGTTVEGPGDSSCKGIVGEGTSPAK